MDPSVYEAAESGEVDLLLSKRDGAVSIDLLHQKTPKRNNILHIAAQHQKVRVFNVLLDDRYSPLFWATNMKGNTPLHVAAGAGCEEIVEFLIEHATRSLGTEGADEERGPTTGEANKKQLRKKNSQGDTALHVAARSGHGGMVNLLMAADPELCCRTNFNKESPLFVATRQGFPLIASSILNDCPVSPSLQGFNGITALHVAVTHTDEHYIGFVNIMASRYPAIIRKADELLGWTPLHYAALKGNLEATQLLMQHDEATQLPIKPDAATQQPKERSVSYILDKSGMSALHVAAYSGHTNVMKELIRRRPDVCDLLNFKSQTALHTAVLGGQIEVINYSLNQQPKLAVLINEADEDGNTPLHLAALKKNCEIIRMLTGERRLDMIAINEELTKASDIFLRDNTGEQELFGSATALSCSVGLPFFQQEITRDFWNAPDRKKDAAVEKEGKAKRRESRLLIATLIATVTFAAAFTLPGGLRSDGRAVLHGTLYFEVFYWFNQLAFVLAAFVIFNEILDIQFLPVRLVTFLIQSSIGGMVVAFMSGLGAIQTGTLKRKPYKNASIVFLAVLLFLWFLLVPTYIKKSMKYRSLQKIPKRGLPPYVFVD